MSQTEKTRKQASTLRREAQEILDAARTAKDDVDHLKRCTTTVNTASKATLGSLRERLGEANELLDNADQRLADVKAAKDALDEGLKDAANHVRKLEQATTAYASARAKIRADGEAQQAFLNKLNALYEDAEATELAKAYEKDSRGKVWGYWLAMAATLGGVLYMHGEAEAWHDHLVALPIYVATLLVWRGLSEQRMLQAECAHTARLLRAVVAFKRELPPTGAKEADVRTAALEAISKNPAERLKETSTSLWSFLETLYKTKGKGLTHSFSGRCP